MTLTVWRPPDAAASAYDDGKQFFNPAHPRFGATYGAGVDLATATRNLAALHAARDAAVAAGYGFVIIAGTLVVSGTVNLEDQSNSVLGLIGSGGNTTGATIKLHASATPTDRLMSLKGSRQVTLRDIALDGGGLVKHVLFCGRNALKDTAGKHYLENVYAIGGTISSHLNWGSEENTYLKCRFQGSAIGAIFTGFEIDDATAATINADPVVSGKRDNPTSSASGGNWDDSTAHHLYDCALGSSTTTRCGLLVQSSQLLMFGGAIQAKSATSEAYVIMDGTRQGAVFSGVTLDSGLANIGWKVGYYSSSAAAATNFANQVVWLGGSWTINTTTGTDFLDAKNLVASTAIGVTCRGGLVDGSHAATLYGIRLRDNASRANTFLNVVYANDGAGTAVTITNSGTGIDNLQIAQGKLTFIAPSGSSNASMLYIQPFTAGITRFLVQPTAAANVGLGAKVVGDTNERFQLLGSGQMNWGDGTGATDTVLVRRSAGAIGGAALAGYFGGGLRPADTSTVVTDWAFKKHYTAAGALDFGSIAAGATAELTLTVAGVTVAAANIAIANPSTGIEAGLSWGAYVSADNTVTVRVANVTASPIDPGSRSWRADVWEH